MVGYTMVWVTIPRLGKVNSGPGSTGLTSHTRSRGSRLENQLALLLRIHLLAASTLPRQLQYPSQTTRVTFLP